MTAEQHPKNPILDAIYDVLTGLSPADHVGWENMEVDFDDNTITMEMPDGVVVELKYTIKG